MNKIYTVGHSTHSIEQFLSILRNRGINVVVDVRSVPYSRFAAQYNMDALKPFLKKNGIDYIPMGNLLGARYEDKSLLFDDGKVSFEKVTRTEGFNEGIKRVNDGLYKGYDIALMCAEKNPLECHRFSLISHFLDERGYEIVHILPDKSISHRVLDAKLLEYFRSKNKITFEMEKVLNPRIIQKDMFYNISKSDLYLTLNKMVAYDSYSKEEDSE